MPNSVKYSTTTPLGSLRKGNVALGISSSAVSGPTSTTGWYSGITPAQGKYVIYQTAASGDPDIYTPQSDTELIRLANSKGANAVTVGNALSFFAGNSSYLPVNRDYEEIVTSNLIVNLDASFAGSYPQSASTWYDLSGNSVNGTLNNGPTYSTNNSGSILFDGTNDSVSLTLPASFGANYSISFWFNLASLAGATEKQLFGSPSDVASISISSNRIGSWNGSAYRHSSTTLSANTWYNFVMVNSTNTVFYLNGNSDSTFASTATLNSGACSLMAIGSIRYLNAYLGNVLFYNKALSASEVSQNYNAQKGKFGL